MSFGGLFDGDSDLPYSGLSLGLQTNQETRHQQTSRMMTLIGAGAGDPLGRNREDENESRSGSGNFEGGSGDELDQEHNNRKRKKYNRHTPQQIQELENLFKECPHPDEKQRMELSKRLCLESKQVKFWFQNRRTQLKTQIERQENSILRHENDKLRAESVSIRDAMRNPTCNNCGGPAMLGEVSIQDQQLRIENARLKDELDRVCSLAGKFLGRPLSAVASPLTPSLSYDFVGNSTPPFAGRGAMGPNLIGDFLSSPGMGSIVTPPPLPSMRSGERSIFLDLAIAAMDEMVKMAKLGAPVWISEGGREVVNYEQYLRSFPRCIGMKPVGYVSEASRETGMVIVNGLALVDAFMDVNQWADMFPCEVSRAATADIISSGIGGSRNGALQLMQAEVQVLSPLVPVRELSFLRFCKQHTEGMWAVVDVSVDSLCEIMSSSAATTMSCRRLPSGLLIEEMPNGYSKVTWVEHAEYDESTVHQLYRPLLRSGVGLGAARWLAALQRQFDCLAILLSSSLPNPDPTGMTAAGRRSMVRLARRMTGSFGAGVSASSAHRWTLLTSASEAVRIMTRQSVDDPGEPSGVVLSAATSVWFPAVDPRRLFDFLRDARLRSEWDILSNGGPMQEMTHIAKGSDRGNAVSLLRATLDKNQWCVYGDESSAVTVRSNNSMLILQETSTDSSGSLVTYAPVDIPAMHVVMAGGDPSYVALLPSGFAVAPDCSAPNNGSLLTVAFQILVNTLPNAKLSLESVDTVTGLLSCTVEKIKNALQID